MELEAKELLELLKTIPAVQSDISVIKKSITDVDAELSNTKTSLSKMSIILDRIDSNSNEIISLKYTVKSLQNNIETITEKLKDLTDKSKDMINNFKEHDKNIDEKIFAMSKTVSKIESQTKESINKQETTEHAIQALTTIVNDISKRENIIENNISNDKTVSLFEKIVKIAPNLIAIISFLGYIIYTLIEHKLKNG